MPEIKLARLPDRTPVKMVINVMPDLAESLAAYASIYRETYERDEPLTELIPAMLVAFLESDRAFQRAHSVRRGQPA